jgi:hypothetical protein
VERMEKAKIDVGIEHNQTASEADVAVGDWQGGISSLLLLRLSAISRPFFVIILFHLVVVVVLLCAYGMY